MPKRRNETLGVERMLDMMRRGVSSQDIASRMDEVSRKTKEGRIKGEQSEINAMRALRGLNYVKIVRQKSRDRNHDYLSHDLEVLLDSIACIQFLNNGLAIPKNQLFVQVVSSQGGIDHFRNMTLNRLGKLGRDEFERYLTNEKLVILNGQLPLQDIQEEFYKQLVSLNLLWASNQ